MMHDMTLGTLTITSHESGILLTQPAPGTHRVDAILLDDEQQLAVLKYLEKKQHEEKHPDEGKPGHSAVDVDGAQRQLILLALAELELRRPGWDYAIGEIADLFGGREMVEQFKSTSKAIATEPLGDRPAGS